MKVTDYLVNELANFGVRHVFMISGGGAMHLVDSVGSHPKLTYFCPHHEQAAAIAAEGYYRASRKLAAVVVTSGPGGTNAVTGVIGQWLDSIPCIYLSGQVKQMTTIASCPELRLRQLGDQEINIADIVRPVTKYAVMLRDPNSVGYHLHKALYLATHGRPGPVWLDVPLDVQGADIDVAALKKYDPREDEIAVDEKQLRAQVRELLERIERSERPVLMAGHGIRIAGAADQFIELVDRLNIPVQTAICGNDLIWSKHPLFFGRPGICGDRHGNMIIQNSDVMLAIGARLGIRQISYDYDGFARDAFRAMVDIDEAELKKPTLRLHMPVRADAKLFIEEMLRQLKGRKLSPKQPWLTWCRKMQRTLPTILQDNPGTPGYVNSYTFADTLFRVLPARSLVLTGNGTAYTGTYQVMQIKRGMRVFANQACASMGYDLPAAIGACLARGGKDVILMTGDGSIQMNIQELQTIAVHRLPIKMFVLDNEGYLSIRITQDAYFNGRHYASEPSGKVVCADAGRIARAYGIAAVRLANERNMADRIRDVLRMKGPVVCTIRMDPKQTVYPKLASVVMPDGRLVSKPLEDMFPYIPREQFEACMLPRKKTTERA